MVSNGLPWKVVMHLLLKRKRSVDIISVVSIVKRARNLCFADKTCNVDRYMKIGGMVEEHTYLDQSIMQADWPDHCKYFILNHCIHDCLLWQKGSNSGKTVFNGKTWMKSVLFEEKIILKTLWKFWVLKLAGYQIVTEKWAYSICQRIFFLDQFLRCKCCCKWTALFWNRFWCMFLNSTATFYLQNTIICVS